MHLDALHFLFNNINTHATVMASTKKTDMIKMVKTDFFAVLNSVIIQNIHHLP